MSQEVNINVENGVKEVEVLTGPAKKHSYPTPIEVKGVLTAPFSYLEKRVSEINQKECNLIVDRDKGTMKLTVCEHSEYSDLIQGSLKLNPDFLKFGINEDKKYTTFQLADAIKMNRYFFADEGTALKLISTLKDFKAKVDKVVEQRTDGRGNDKSLRESIVSSNIPESFNMHLPVFKGQTAETFEVEISINGIDLSCSLVSPEINDIINKVKDESIDKELDQIKKLAPDLAILEV